MSAVTRSWSNWVLATSILERFQAAPDGATRGEAVACLRSLGEERLGLWRTIPQFNDKSALDRRFALVGIDSESDLPDILGAELRGVRFGRQPKWAKAVTVAYFEPDEPFADIRTSVLSPGVMTKSEGWQTALSAVVEPLLNLQRHRYRTALLERTRTKTEQAEVELILNASLPSSFRYVVGAFVTDMHAREAGDAPLGNFNSYIADVLTGGGIRRLIDRYPVLGRNLAGMCDKWVRSQSLLARRYLRDRAALASFLGAQTPELELKSVDPGLGDPHNDLQTTTLLSFINGTRIVYKPVDCGASAALKELLGLLNGSGRVVGFEVPNVVARRGYGWAEYIRHVPAGGQGELTEYCERIGSMLAIGWLLGATDLHAENVVANGCMPFLVDFETILGADSGTPVYLDGAGAETGVALAMASMRDSVMRTGLLPTRIQMNNTLAMDPSLLGWGADATMPIFGWADAGTTKMRKVPMTVSKPVSASLPFERDRSPGAADWDAAAIERGFRLTCDQVWRERRSLLGRSDLWKRFGRSRYRLILRNTATYMKLAQDLSHPALLTNGLDRDRHLDYLLAGNIGNARLEAIGLAERMAVAGGDVPYFSVSGDGKDLLFGKDILIPDCLDASPVELVQSRLASFSSADIGRQVWYIRTSLRVAELNQAISETNSVPRPMCCADVTDGAEPSREELLTAVECICRELLNLSYDGGSWGVCWPTVRTVEDGVLRIGPAGNSLYAGSAGIALFLSSAAVLLGDRELEAVARRALAPVIAELVDGRVTSTGAYQGVAGYLYLLLCLQRLGTADYSDIVTTALRAIRDRAASDSSVDVLSGVAGAGLVLANCISDFAGSQLAVDAAVACAERLRMSAIRAPDGAVSWPSVATDSVALTGFSHGAAGTGLACLKLGQLLGESQVSALWDAARIFESLHFLESEGNWADLRPKDLETDGTASRSNISAWCNGAVGIGLARCLAILWNPHQGSGVGILDEIGVALRTAKLTGCGYSQSLCHGDLGTMEFHLAASRLEKFASESTFALGIAKMVCDSVNNGYWRCGVPPGINVPGLMTGLAGIGYGLLRIAAPKAANVLCLEL